MSLPIMHQDAKLAVLLEMTSAGGVLDGIKAHLTKAPLAVTATTALASFTAIEADYTGYAAQSIATWGAPYIGIDGLPHVTGPHKQFQASDGVTPNVIYAIFYTDTAGTTLIYSVTLDAPVPLVDAIHALIVEPDYVYGS